jgi:hypothetical protein
MKAWWKEYIRRVSGLKWSHRKLRLRVLRGYPLSASWLKRNFRSCR